ncbi:MAG TPA: hypothetical protein VGO47_01545, partial [Chlamydiales bacterium]|nr:hypothetical protein [Chlamydiales bacterium]
MSSRETVRKGGKVLPQVKKGKSDATRHFFDLEKSGEKKRNWQGKEKGKIWQGKGRKFANGENWQGKGGKILQTEKTGKEKGKRFCKRRKLARKRGKDFAKNRGNWQEKLAGETSRKHPSLLVKMFSFAWKCFFFFFFLSS